jgi:hypothetical protein
MPDPTYEQLVALDDAIATVFEAGMDRQEIEDRVASALDDLEGDDDA